MKTMQNRLQWYIARLSCMSMAEVAFRTKTAGLTALQRSGLFTVPAVPEPVIRVDSWPLVSAGSAIGSKAYCDAADQIIAGRYSVFSIAEPGTEIWDNWIRDIRTGVVAPLSFGKTLNYRDQSVVGDIKYLWEPNRHLHLVTLAQAFALTGESRYLDAIARHLKSWLDQNPYLLGPNWTSSLELGIRLINWAIVWTLIGGASSVLFDSDPGRRLRQQWLDSIFQHCHFIQGHFSRYSSANNHLIGEAAGLFVATVNWPYWPQFESWRRTAKSILEKEALEQNAPDGVNREQAVSYQQFVLDFLLLCGLLGRRADDEFSSSFWSRIESMMEYIASVMDVGGNVPMIGDADDGYVVNLSAEPGFCSFRSLLATGAVLFNRSDFKAKAGTLDDKTRWLLGGDADKDYDAIAPGSHQLPVRRVFPDGGYYILGCNFETPDEIRLIADAGPIGYQGIAAHGHADALAFVLSLGGHEILIDPGTYAYHTQKKWRDYFRGTSAHNTVRIDGADQSVSGGNFMWLSKAQARCEVWEPGETHDRFAGSHDGYMRLGDPVRHYREISLDKTSREILVTDRLECSGSHDCEFFWHVAEHCEVSVDGQSVTIVCGPTGITLQIDQLVDRIEVVSGDSERPLGWVSRRYDVKAPSSTVVGHARLAGTQSFVTKIQCMSRF